MRVARERPGVKIMGMTPNVTTARAMALVWGIHPVLAHNVVAVDEITEQACSAALREKLATPGQTIVIAAGIPFGQPGTTNLMRIAQVG
jgi:pyruvate kinase